MPDTSCSGEYPDMIRFFRILTNCGTSYKKVYNRREDVSKAFVSLTSKEYSVGRYFFLAVK